MGSKLLMLAAAVLLLTGAQAQGLLAHWPLDELVNGVTPDVTGHGYDATFTATGGRQPEFVEGMVGKAVRLDEAHEGFFAVAKSGDFSFRGPFTVMAWVRPSRRDAAFEIACLKGDRSGDPPYPGWRLRYAWTTVLLELGAPGGDEPRVSSPEWSVPAGFWSHVAGSWDGKTLRVFVNAVEKASREFSGEMARQHPWIPLVLGNYIGRKNAYAFDGLLDDIKVFDRALSEEEVFAEAK